MIVSCSTVAHFLFHLSQSFKYPAFVRLSLSVSLCDRREITFDPIGFTNKYKNDYF